MYQPCNSQRIRLPGNSFRFLLPAAFLMPWAAGCSQVNADRAEREKKGFVFYCDGSGGGGLLNYSNGIRQGLLDAGYNGYGEMFKWNTGLGITADHTSSESYKRDKARELANQIAVYSRKFPGAPITLMGLSAGTAVAVFALEYLPAGVDAENVFLLSPSISADYDLTRALRHVREKMYVFCSAKDAVLTYLVANVGTADRKREDAAGIAGFRRPARGSRETMTEYAKVVNIQWRPEFTQYGDTGGHTDVVKAPFVRHYIAPLIMPAPTRAEDQAIGKRVANPDYDRWAKVGVGSWASWKGSQTLGGSRQAIRLVATLIEKNPDSLIVERRYYNEGDEDSHPFRVQTTIMRKWIEPEGHPLTHPARKVEKLAARPMAIGGSRLTCDGWQVDSPGQFDDWGVNLRATGYGNDGVPGFWTSIKIQAMKENEPFEFEGQVESYQVKR